MSADVLGATSTTGGEPEGSAPPPDPPSPTSPTARPLTARTAAVTISAQYLARVAGMAAAIVSVAVVARVLDVATYADWATVVSLVVVVGVLIDPSLSPVVVRLLVHDPARTPTARAMLPVRLGFGLVALVVVVGASVALRGTGVWLLALALGGQLVARAVVLNALPWLQTDHRLHRLSALEAGAAVVGLGLLLGASALDAPAPLLALAGLTGPAAVLALVSLREVRLTPSSRLPPPGPQRERIAGALREMAPLAGALVLTAVISRVHTAFVNVAEGDVAVAQYLFAFSFVEQIIVLAGIVAGALLPMLAARARDSDLFADPRTRELALAVAALGALGCAGLVAIAGPLCSIVGGAKLAGADRYLVPLAPMAIILPLAFLLGYVHLALGRGRRYLRINLAALALTLALNGALTLTLGADATARIAWVVELFVVVAAFLPFLRAGGGAGLTLARMLGLVALCVAGAELAAAGVVAPVVAGLLLAAAVAALEGRRVGALVAAVRGR